MNRVPYPNAVGSLIYVMVSTRPNILHVIGVVSRYMENLGKEHWGALKWVLQYLKGTSNYCITYNGISDSVCGYVDSDFVGGLDKMRSTSGYVFTLAGGVVSWISKLHNVVSLFTIKVEYMVVSHACKEEIGQKVC